VKTLINYLAIGGGGCLGAMLRYFLSTLCARLFGTAFPVGTFVINIGGSFLLGWFLVVVQRRIPASDPLHLAIAIGFLGAFTTFSTLMYESSALLGDGSGMKAMFNLMGSLLIGLMAVRLGMVLGDRF